MELRRPSAKSVDPSSIKRMMGAFAGVASLLEDLVPITEFGADDAVKPQSFDPKAPPAGDRPAEDAAVAMMNTAIVFGPIVSLLLLNKI